MSKSDSPLKRFSNVDENVVKNFSGTLKTILELELAAGNRIVETFESKEGSFPIANATMIFLAMPFKTPIQRNIKDIEYTESTDRHYWQGEYFDKETRQFLCCGFGDVNFEK